MSDLLKKYEQEVGKVEKILESPRRALERFPTIFLLLVTAGAVLVFFGFERLFDQIPALRENPILMIFAGVAILVLTGKLFKKLS